MTARSLPAIFTAKPAAVSSPEMVRLPATRELLTWALISQAKPAASLLPVIRPLEGCTVPFSSGVPGVVTRLFSTWPRTATAKPAARPTGSVSVPSAVMAALTSFTEVPVKLPPSTDRAIPAASPVPSMAPETVTSVVWTVRPRAVPKTPAAELPLTVPGILTVTFWTWPFLATAATPARTEDSPSAV